MKLSKNSSVLDHEHTNSIFDTDGGFNLDKGDDLIEENMSQLGKVIHNQDYDLWKSLDLSSVTFIAVLTHECRRAGTYDVLSKQKQNKIIISIILTMILLFRLVLSCLSLDHNLIIQL